MNDQAHPTTDILGVILYTSIMGTFHLPTFVNYIRSTSLGDIYRDFNLISNKTDPWILPMQVEPEVQSSTLEVAY